MNWYQTALNLKTPKGVGIFLSLVKTADIVIEQFRPGVLDEMGIGYNQARQVKEDIIYVSITGYGQYGPYAKDAGHDINYIGYAGILLAPAVLGFIGRAFSLTASFALVTALLVIMSTMAMRLLRGK